MDPHMEIFSVSLLLHCYIPLPAPRSWLWPMGSGVILQGLVSASGPWLPLLGPRGLGSSPQALGKAPGPWE